MKIINKKNSYFKNLRKEHNGNCTNQMSTHELLHEIPTKKILLLITCCVKIQFTNSNVIL